MLYVLFRIADLFTKNELNIIHAEIKDEKLAEYIKELAVLIE